MGPVGHAFVVSTLLVHAALVGVVQRCVIELGLEQPWPLFREWYHGASLHLLLFHCCPCG